MEAFVFQQFPAYLEHTGPSLITSSCLPSSPGAPPSTSKLLSSPRGCHGTPNPAPVGSSSQTSMNTPAGMGTPRTALNKLLKIQGLLKEKPATIRKEEKCFFSFSSTLFFFTHVSQIFNFLFYYQYIEQGGFKVASFSWVHLFSVPYTLILVYYFALQDCFFVVVLISQGYTNLGWHRSAPIPSYKLSPKV